MQLLSPIHYIRLFLFIVISPNVVLLNFKGDYNKCDYNKCDHNKCDHNKCDYNKCVIPS